MYVKITKEQSSFRIETHESYTNLFFERGFFTHADFYRGLLHADTFSAEAKTPFFYGVE